MRNTRAGWVRRAMRRWARAMGTISLFPGRTKLPTHTDAEALASDWRKVGEDMRTVTEQYALDDPPPWINRHRHG